MPRHRRNRPRLRAVDEHDFVPCRRSLSSKQVLSVVDARTGEPTRTGHHPGIEHLVVRAIGFYVVERPDRAPKSHEIGDRPAAQCLIVAETKLPFAREPVHEADDLRLRDVRGIRRPEELAFGHRVQRLVRSGGVFLVLVFAYDDGIMPKFTGLSLQTLDDRLGRRLGTGTSGALNRHRFRILWYCNGPKAGPACLAIAEASDRPTPPDLTAFEQEFFENAPLPKDGWTLWACPQHRSTFIDYPEEPDEV